MSSYSHDKVSLNRLATSSLTPGLTSEAVVSFYEALDCPRSLMAAILFRYKEYDQLVGLECDPKHYENGASFRDAYLASSFLVRSKFLETSFNREELALQKFKRFEEVCAVTNARFRERSDDYLSTLDSLSSDSEVQEWARSSAEGWVFIDTPNERKQFLSKKVSSEVESPSDFESSRVIHPRGAALMSRMRRKIFKILGEFDPEELYDLSSWGPGVSNLIKGEETFASKKFQYETGVTRDLHPLVAGTFPVAYPGWWKVLESSKDWPSFEVGNAIITVPKTSKIDRVIAVEPGVNLWFQLGVGRMIRRRLGRVGIDLTDQGANQRAALKGSLTGHLATVDFSSASDSIALELVRNLFSENCWTERWFEVMDVVRSKYGVLGGKTFRWNKFSSMGNGFTFDLETLIFYVAAVAACEEVGCDSSEVSVYGDDVIIPSVAYSTFAHLAEYLGFTVNKQKSFSDGCFRESCGAHYYRGLDCKPLYLEEELSLPVRVYNFANTLRIRAKHAYQGCDVRFRRLFYLLVASVPKQIRFRVSAVCNDRSGDVEPVEGGFISNFDEACPTRAEHGVEGYHVKRASWVSVSTETEYEGHLLARLSSITAPLTDPLATYSKETKARGNANPLRGRTKCLITKMLVRRWCDLGPWVK